jgi:pimeloyl-ACP methyl ester carboxylesterase
LSDHLTRQGIAVLRYDDRGVGSSTGDRAIATIDDFAEDAEAGVAFLENHKDLKGVKIGLVGHSEGGMVAPMVAARNKKVDFIVLLAGPGMPIDELMILQSKLITASQGAPQEVSEANRKVLKDAYSYIRQNPSLEGEKMKAGLIKVFQNGMKYFSAEIQEEIKKDEMFFEKEAAGLISPWFLNFIRTTPEDYLKKVKVPVLALNGTLDLQVPAEENLAVIKAALKKAGNKKVEIVALKGLNHLFQTAQTGAVAEYGKIEETFNPMAMEKIASWIKKQ